MTISTIINNKKSRKILKKISVLLFWIVVWQTVSLIVGREILVASPLRVFQRLVELSITIDFWKITLMSLFRVMSGFIIGIVLGLITAALTFKIKAFYILLSPFLTVIRVTPIASFIILALVWMRNGSVPVFISFLIVLPIIWSGVSTGLESVDRQLYETAVMYGFSPLKFIKILYLPSVVPFFKTASINAVGLAWKTGVAAEVLCTPAFSIGRRIYESKLYLETTDLYAWTAALIIISLIIEHIIRTVMLFGRRNVEYSDR